MTRSQHVYEIRPRKDKRGFDLISDTLPFGRLWYGEPNAITNAIGYAKFFSRSHPAIIRVFDEWGAVIETHNQRVIFANRDSPFVLRRPMKTMTIAFINRANRFRGI